MLEEEEIHHLAPYATLVKYSKGREYSESEPKYRTAFQRDRDRIYHTSAFRRLEYKTQVFVNHEGDYYRTRLTHTLEVAQIARSIAAALGCNEDLAEAISLVHDIGHPPFGHSGESTLAKLMKDNGGFDHNRQSLRIVQKLERRYPDFPGLNLTYEVREGMVKHETEYDVKGIAEGYQPNKRGSIEAQIVNIADELTYTTHDLDDGLYAGLITADMLNDVELWGICQRKTGQHTPGVEELQRHCVIRELVGTLVEDVITTTSRRLSSLIPKSLEDVQLLSENIVGYSDEIFSMHAKLKTFLYRNMYTHYRQVRMAEKAERFLTELFHAYVSNPSQLPPTTLKLVGNPDPLQRVVCDYIAGMTDRYALEEYKMMFDPMQKP